MRSLIEDGAKSAFEIGPNGMGLDLLRAVYRNVGVELSIRIRCAMACLPFESPKLAVVAQVTENDIATILDRRIARLQEMENSKLIEAQPNADEQTNENGGNSVDARLPPPIPDRRYRRF